jgi:hypothetical protein
MMMMTGKKKLTKKRRIPNREGMRKNEETQTGILIEETNEK